MSFFQVDFDTKDLSVPVSKWTKETRNTLQQWNPISDLIEKPNANKLAGAAAGAGLAGGAAKVIGLNPFARIGAVAVGGILGTMGADFIPTKAKPKSKGTKGGKGKKDTVVDPSAILLTGKLPSGNTMWKGLGMDSPTIQLIEKEMTILIDLEARAEPNVVPLIVPRTTIVILEDLIRTYLIDQIPIDIKRSIQPKLRKWDDELERICTISSNPEERKCSWGSIARWCKIVEQNIEDHPPFQDAYQKLMGDPFGIFKPTQNETSLSKILRDLAPIRNNLMHSYHKLHDQDPHSTIVEKCFKSTSLREWWTKPVSLDSLFNRMLHNIYILRKTALK